MKIEVTFKQDIESCKYCHFICFPDEDFPVCSIALKKLTFTNVNKMIPNWCPGRYENRED